MKVLLFMTVGLITNLAFSGCHFSTDNKDQLQKDIKSVLVKQFDQESIDEQMGSDNWCSEVLSSMTDSITQVKLLIKSWTLLKNIIYLQTNFTFLNTQAKKNLYFEI